MWTRCDRTNPVATAPTDWADASQPYSTSVTCRISRATNGSSVLADEKKVAKKSSTMLDRMTGLFRIKRMPSPIARKPGTARFWPGLGVLRDRAHGHNRAKHRHERDRVEEIGIPLAKRANHHAAQRRADDRAGAPGDRVAG